MKQTRRLVVLVIAIMAGLTACGGNEADFEVELTPNAQGLVIKKYLGTAASVRVPAVIQNMPVLAIAEKAFAARDGEVQLTGVTLPAGLTAIGRYAFQNQRALKKVTLPATLTAIGEGAFADTGLASADIPDSVTALQPYTFRGAALRSIRLPAAITELPRELFTGCYRLTAIVIPEGVTRVGNAAFSGCTALTTATFPATLTAIDGGAFGGCTSLAALTIPDTTTSLTFGYDSHAFAGCPSLPLASQARLKQLGYRGVFGATW